MKILTTGSNGMLGQDMCPVLEDVGAFIIETDIEEMDITNIEQTERVISNSKPDLIVHMAAYSDVNKAETEKEIATKTNIEGTKNIVEVCKSKEIPLIYISSDYVFDGTKQTPYESDDTTNPINYYGFTKLKGEEFVRTCPKHYIIRTGTLYGHHGESFVSRILKQHEAEIIKVESDRICSPTWTIELANGVLRLLQKPFGTYNICGSGAVSRYEFAKELYKAFDLDENKIQPCSTTDLNLPAKRPLYTVMNNQGLCRDWKVALKDFVMLSDID